MKTTIKYAFIALLCAVSGTKVYAQQDVLLSRYMFNGLLINPAYAGSHDYGSVGAIFRKQWAGFDGAPITSMVFADMPLLKYNMGAGINLSYDKIGATEQTDMNLNYAYHLKLDKTTKLGFGLKAGMMMYRSSLSNLTVWDENDPEFNSVQSKIIPNFGTGIYIYGEQYYAGISVPELLSYDKETIFSANPGIALKTVRHYYLTGGYVFHVNDKFDLKPSALMRYTYNTPLQADVNFQLYFKRLFSLGGSYRTGDAVVFMGELLSLPNWRFGYAYDLSVSTIRKYNNGSHEIMVAYDFSKKENKQFRFF